MLAGHALRMVLANVLLLTGGATGSIEDKPHQPQTEARLGRILNDWKRRSYARTNLDVRFVGNAHYGAWGKELFAGRVVLLSKAADGPAITGAAGRVSRSACGAEPASSGNGLHPEPQGAVSSMRFSSLS